MTDLCATNLSRGDRKTLSGPASSTPTLRPLPPQQGSLPESSLPQSRTQRLDQSSFF